jgi:hypothetical protein
MGGETPEELESLLEDAIVLRDSQAVADLFEPGGVVVAGRGVPAARGVAEVAGAGRRIWSRGAGYLADPRRVLRVHGLALVVGTWSVTVARRGVDGMWRYAFGVFRDAGLEEERTMHTIVVRMAADPSRTEDVVRHIRDDVVGWARSRPGFVSGQWLLATDGLRGLGVIVFDSADTAEQAAAGPRNYTRDEARAWNVDSVEVYEQVAAADQTVMAGDPSGER